MIRITLMAAVLLLGGCSTALKPLDYKAPARLCADERYYSAARIPVRSAKNRADLSSKNIGRIVEVRPYVGFSYEFL
jgi:uncharacterized lipoprotein YajG